MVAMAAVVAAVLYSPLAIALGVFLGVCGVPLDAFMTFGGAVNRYAGVLAWAFVAFALALAHVALAFPWAHTRGFHVSRKK